MNKTSSRRVLFLISAALAAVVLAAYWGVLGNGFVSYDDTVYVTENARVSEGLSIDGVIWAFKSGHASNWHPVTWLSHMLDCEFFGLNPLWHHLVNLVFHVINTVLLLWLLWKMTGAIWPSAFVAAAFGLHPMHVESVAWVAERKDVLSTLFWMLTMAAYLVYVRRRSLPGYLLVIAIYSVGLMAKPMLVTLPFVLLLLDWWPLNRLATADEDQNKRSRRPHSKACICERFGLRYLLLEKAPLIALAIISCAVTYFVQKNWGAMSLGEEVSSGQRMANAVVSYVAYIGKMVYPAGLAVLYPFGTHAPVWKWSVCLGVLAIVSAAVFVRGRRQKYLVTGWLWYVGTLVPVIGLVQVGGQALADRYSYIPYVGLFIIVGWGYAELASKRCLHRGITVVLAMAVLLLCVLVTRRQVSYWENSHTLFKHTLSVTEGNFIIHNNYGNELLREGDADLAMEHYREAIEINPHYSIGLKNLGMALVKRKQFAEAVEYLNHAAELSPDWHEIYNSLALAYVQQGDYEQANANFGKALELKPDYAEAHFNMGLATHEQKRYAEAERHFLEALKVRGDWVEAHNRLGRVYLVQGKLDLAAEELAQIAVILAGRGDYVQASNTCQKALELAVQAKAEKLSDEIRARLDSYESMRMKNE